jgi:hypothetical protein
MRGVVVLPPSYTRTKQDYTTAYVIPGFASDISFIAKLAPFVSVEGMANGAFPEMFHVVIDESCPDRNRITSCLPTTRVLSHASPLLHMVDCGRLSGIPQNSAWRVR